jgi:hypothetical protein
MLDLQAGRHRRIPNILLPSLSITFFASVKRNLDIHVQTLWIQVYYFTLQWLFTLLCKLYIDDKNNQLVLLFVVSIPSMCML